MKKVLYLTNIKVPYRVRFFNELAKLVDLTVIYERSTSNNRDAAWASSEEACYKAEYLDGKDLGGENRFSLRLLGMLSGYDAVIVGCYNSPVQIMAMLSMKLRRIPYYINADGETFLEGSGLKKWLKRRLLSGAKGYLAAGEKSAESLGRALGVKAYPYYFSSLSRQELADNAQAAQPKNGEILVVGQYFPYKGLDVALEAARMSPELTWHFVGMGGRKELFLQETGADKLANVRVDAFLQKEELYRRYQGCAMMVLPSRQECWGLVINEAASFACPIVATTGSGAAQEFLQDHPQFLAEPDNAGDLLQKVKDLLALSEEERFAYGEALRQKGSRYSIEAGVEATRDALEEDQ